MKGTERHVKATLLFFVSATSFAQSPLDVTSGLQGMVERHLTEVAKKMLDARSARMAQIRTPTAVRERQDYIRRTLIEEIGGFPENHAGVHSRIHCARPPPVRTDFVCSTRRMAR